VRRRTWVIGGALIVVAILIVTSVQLWSRTPPTSTAPATSASSATVQRETLAAQISQNGTLTYGSQPDGWPYVIVNQARGVLTSVPTPGTVITNGETLYRVNNTPVVLLYGATPAYRVLVAGMSGPDVAQLNTDLVALGYATSGQLNPKSDYFGSATTAAVRPFQDRVGLPSSGVIGLGAVVFEPTALRVSAISATLGGAVSPGQPTMQATSTSRRVVLDIDASQQASIAVGDKVRITLPNEQTTPGVVASVGAVATCPSSTGQGPTSAGVCTSGGGSPVVAVTVNPTDPKATGSWDQAPVKVRITTGSVADALVVPITALLAQAGGGYAVEVTGEQTANTTATSTLAAVTLGLFDDEDGLVQVSGSGLKAGQHVVVPSA
jgi:peptidoglycan hydrolase-like protein with peptidoglycan-binding domain